MQGYVKRRVSDLTLKPRLFHSKGYLSDLDNMIQEQYVAQLQGSEGGEAMVKMLLDLETKEKNR